MKRAGISGFVCVAALVALGACSGDGSAVTANLAGDALVAGPPATGDVGIQQAPVMPSPQSALRAISTADADRFRFGSSHLTGLVQGGLVTGTTLSLDPEYNPAAVPPVLDLAYSVYGFELAGYSDTAVISQGWGTPPADPADLWIGVGRYSTDAWQWFSPGLSELDLADLTPYLSDTDQLVVAVVLTGTAAASLDWLRVGGPTAPVADLTADPLAGDAPLGVTFDASASYTRGAATLTYVWDFDGDGLFGEDNGEAAAAGSAQPQFTYSAAGEYEPAVRVVDDQGLSAEASVTITVSARQLQLSGRLTDGEAAPVVGAEIALTGAVEDTATTDANGDYSFTLYPGSYTVKPTAYGLFFNPHSLDVELIADPVTDADFTASGTWLHTWGGSAEETIAAVAIDGEDNVYAVGRSNGLGSASDWEVLILKYDCYGARQWTKTWGGIANEIGQCATLDAAGNLYVTGYTTSFGAGGYDIFVLKFNPNGDLEWQTVWGNSALQEAFDIAVAANGDVYIAGRFANKTLLLKLDATSLYQWGYTYWGTDSSFNYVKELVLSGSDIYMAGFTYYQTGLDYNALVLRYDTSGELQWAKEWDRGDEDMLDCLALDGNGNLICAGHCNAGNGAQDGLLLSLSPAGALNWETIWGTTAFELFYGLEVRGGTAYLAGMYGSSGRGLLLAANPATGIPDWSQGFNMTLGSETTIAYDVAGYGNGVFITGGTAPNINGAWEEVTGTVVAEAGTFIDPGINTYDMSTAGVRQILPESTVTSPSAEEDYGGGSGDFGLFMYLPPAV